MKHFRCPPQFVASCCIAAFFCIAFIAGCRGASENEVESRLGPQKTLDAAWADIKMANWPAAQALLEQLLADSSNIPDEIKAQANYALAHVYQHRTPSNDLALAGKYYRCVVDDFPESEARPWAMLALARMENLPASESKYNRTLAQMTADLTDQYLAIISQYPGHDCSHEAALWRAVLGLEDLSNPQARLQAASFLQDYVAQYPDNYLANTMYTVLGRYYQSLENYPEAVKYYVAAAEAGYAAVYDAAMEYYRLARLAEYKLGDMALARTWYYKVVTEVPRNFRYFPSLQGLNRCNAALGLPQYVPEDAVE